MKSEIVDVMGVQAVKKKACRQVFYKIFAIG
jgi:hypothetical protein